MSLPALCDAGIKSTRTMLLISGSGGGAIASVFVIDARWPPKQQPYSTRILRNAHKVSKRYNQFFKTTELAKTLQTRLHEPYPWHHEQ